MYCKKCGKLVLEDGKGYCPYCNEPLDDKVVKYIYCPNCGQNMVKGTKTCPSCGRPVGTTEQPTSPNMSVPIINNLLRTKKKFIIIGAVIALIIAIIISVSVCSGTSCNSSQGVDFNKVYNEYCKASWAEVGADGSYLSIDTNPYDFDDEGLYYIDAYYAIDDINDALGIPSYLYKEMGETTGLDGRQTREFSDIGIEVSWKYHPDTGLEVTYKRK